MWAEIKKRFMTLETLEGQTYFWVGGGLLVGYAMGLFQLILNVVPFVAVLLISAGVYKTFIKRGGSPDA